MTSPAPSFRQGPDGWSLLLGELLDAGVIWLHHWWATWLDIVNATVGDVGCMLGTLLLVMLLAQRSIDHIGRQIC